MNKITNMWRIYFIAIGIFFSSCGANYHLKRAYKHLKIAEQKGASVSTDTVYKSVEVIRPGIRTDTIVKYLTLVDTIKVNSVVPGRPPVKVLIKVDTLRKTIYVRGDCPPDTTTIKVPVSTTTTIKPARGWGLNWLAYVICATLGFAVGRAMRKMLT